MLSLYTTYLAENLCGGSSRKLIAGWWYSILVMTLILAMMSFLVLGSRQFSEGFASFWSGIMLIGLSVGGTMIMRRFHNSMAVGFFMGCVVAMGQMFLLLCLVYFGYHYDQGKSAGKGSGVVELWMSLFSFLQAVLLGSFAAILAAHRSEILEKPGNVVMEMMDEMHGIKPGGDYGG